MARNWWLKLGDEEIEVEDILEEASLFDPAQIFLRHRKEMLCDVFPELKKLSCSTRIQIISEAYALLDKAQLFNQRFYDDIRSVQNKKVIGATHYSDGATHYSGEASIEFLQEIDSFIEKMNWLIISSSCFFLWYHFFGAVLGAMTAFVLFHTVIAPLGLMLATMSFVALCSASLVQLAAYKNSYFSVIGLFKPPAALQDFSTESPERSQELSFMISTAD